MAQYCILGRIGEGAHGIVFKAKHVEEITELPDYNKIFFKDQAPMPLGELLPDAPPQALDLLGHFVLYPPRQRIAASQKKDPML